MFVCVCVCVQACVYVCACVCVKLVTDTINETKCHKHAFIWAITVNVKDMYTSLAIYPHVANA